MDYLLVSKINEFYQWQNELLIESFIQKNLISNLKLSFFAEAKMGISKRNTVKINSFLGTFLGVGYQF